MSLKKHNKIFHDCVIPICFIGSLMYKIYTRFIQFFAFPSSFPLSFATMQTEKSVYKYNVHKTDWVTFLWQHAEMKLNCQSNEPCFWICLNLTSFHACFNLLQIIFIACDHVMSFNEVAWLLHRKWKLSHFMVFNYLHL